MSKYTDIVEEVFSYTSKERFMGGELQQVRHITENILFIESERRMDVNMMITLRSNLNGHVICGSFEGNVLIIECGDFNE